MCGCRGGGGWGTGGPDPPENHKKLRFLSNTGLLDPLEITKLPSHHSMLGHHQHTSKTPSKWCFAGGPMMAAYSGIWIFPPLKLKKQQKKTVTAGPTLTKLSGSAHCPASTKDCTDKILGQFLGPLWRWFNVTMSPLIQRFGSQKFGFEFNVIWHIWLWLNSF